VCPQFVMLAKWPKVISYHIVTLSIVLLCLLNSFIRMSRVLPRYLLVAINITLALLMTLQNSHGFILWLIELMCSTLFSPFKPMKSASLTLKSNMFSPTGVWNTKRCTTNFLLRLALVIVFPALTHINKMARPNENIVILLKRVLRFSSCRHVT
jgi:hypothetical protein